MLFRSEMAELPSVASVFEEYYTTMEDDLLFRGSAPNEKTAELAADASEIQSKRNYLWVILLFTAMLALLMWRYYPKFKNKIQ